MKSYSDIGDSELVALLKSGDEQALSALYMRYWDKLLAVACNRLNDPPLAEEILQNIFLKLWKRREQLELKYSLATYLSVAVKYEVINALSRQHREKGVFPETVAYEEPCSQESPEQYLLEKELQQRLEESVLALPEKCRIVFRLSREEGKTNKQIAEELSISEKTVEAHMTKALKDIRSDLQVAAPFIFFLLSESSYILPHGVLA